MINSLWICITLSAFAIVITIIFFDFFIFRKKNKNINSPPSPKSIPILGHLHLLGANPHQDFHNLAKKHGPIMHLRFGFVSNIIVSTPHAAEQFLKTHDQVFATRPFLEAAKFFTFGNKDVSYGQYGPYWRGVRKLCTLNLLSSVRVNSFQAMRKREIGLFVESLKRAAMDRDVVDLSEGVAGLSADMTCLMAFGKKYDYRDFDERGFKTVIKELMQLLVAPNLADIFPFIGLLDLQGLNRRMKDCSKVFDEFLEKIIDEHEQCENDQADDFVYTLLDLMKSGDPEFQFDRQNIKAIMLLSSGIYGRSTDMLAAGMDTSAAIVDWILSELLKHPRVMKKLQQELEDAVGLNRTVEESDLSSLRYLDMVIKEGFRLHPVVPLLLPHAAREDCTVNGFQIPKGATVMINVWAIGRDRSVWSEPEEFIPERFEGSSVDVRGLHFELLPFGSGRRSCPAMQLGLTLARNLVAQLVHCFDWELPNGIMPTELDMTEEFGLVLTRAKHLMATPTFRLRK